MADDTAATPPDAPTPSPNTVAAALATGAAVGLLAWMVSGPALGILLGAAAAFGTKLVIDRQGA